MGATASHYNWTDDYLIQETHKLCVENVWENILIKKILTRFWSYYITGDYHNEKGCGNIIGCAILISVEPTEKGKVEYLFKNIVSTSAESQPFVMLGEFLPDHQYTWDYGAKIRNSSSNDYYAFAKYVRSTLNAWKVEVESISQDVLDLMKLTSVVSMMALRASLKHIKDLERAFTSEELPNNIRIATVMHGPSRYAPPCYKFVKGIKEFLGNSSTWIVKNLLMILVARYTIERKLNVEADMSVVKLLTFGCLKEVALNGLQIIKLLYLCLKYLNVELEDFISITYTSMTKRSWDKINRYITECLLKTNFQYSAHWCRLLMYPYYYDLKYDENIRLMAIMGEIVSAAENNPGIWKSVWGREAEKFAVNAGTNIYNALKKKNKSPSELVLSDKLPENYNFNTCKESLEKMFVILDDLRERDEGEHTIDHLF